MKKELSRRQRQIYEFVAGYVQENCFSPSIRDIASALSLAESTTIVHITAMKKKGYITSMNCVPRSFRLLKPADQTSDTTVLTDSR